MLSFLLQLLNNDIYEMLTKYARKIKAFFTAGIRKTLNKIQNQDKTS